MTSAEVPSERQPRKFPQTWRKVPVNCIRRLLKVTMQERSIQKSLKILSLLTIVLIALGSYVRATGAGLSCPDWPLCFGRAVPKFEYGVAQEVIHRYIAAGVMLFSIFILYRGYRLRAKENGTFIFGLSIVSIVIVSAKNICKAVSQSSYFFKSISM